MIFYAKRFYYRHPSKTTWSTYLIENLINCCHVTSYLTLTEKEEQIAKDKGNTLFINLFKLSCSIFDYILCVLFDLALIL